MPLTGREMPTMRVKPPGPESLRLAEAIRRYESPNVTYLSDRFPVFWEAALGANVRDVDGNVYVDLTAAFAVAGSGHAHPRIVEAITRQAGQLLHAMGDIHPAAIKAELLQRLAEITPGSLSRSILANSGSEAVEAALKTVMIATGKPRVLAFRGGYHGLTMGSLAVSGRADFKQPFARQLADTAVLVDYPDPYRQGGAEEACRRSLASVESALNSAKGDEVGAVLAEPVQGRGGDLVPPNGWLRALRRICEERGILLVLDEIYTGFGRTGKWFACQHWDVVPDILVLGKALTGGMPFAACVATDAVMEHWPTSTGEAIHTSTFLGHPLGCAAALAAMEVLASEDLVSRSEIEGRYFRERLQERLGDNPRVGEIRGLGLMIGIELVTDRASREPDPHLTSSIVVEALSEGYLLLGGGVRSNVLSLSPPFMIDRTQMDGAVDMLGRLLDRQN